MLYKVMAAIDHYRNMDDFPFNQSSPLDLSNYVLFDEGPVECPMPMQLSNEVQCLPADGDGGDGSSRRRQVAEFQSGSSEESRKEGGGLRVAFRTKSEVDIMEDGFKWRKYGKKYVKNSPNPRNYYRCSTEGCSVKKRVKRDPQEPSYVITTYDGVHNHSSPDVVYYATQDVESGRFVVSGCHQFPPSS